MAHRKDGVQRHSRQHADNGEAGDANGDELIECN
jgi:hypothetical protein